MRSTLLVALLAGIALTGCSSDAGSTSTAAATPSSTPSAAAPTHTPIPGGGSPEEGKLVFQGTCAACHGQDGHGIMNLGKSLVGSQMLELDDKDLVAFVEKGRDTRDKANTTGVAMPPKGGNPALSEKDLLNAVAYIRTLK